MRVRVLQNTPHTHILAHRYKRVTNRNSNSEKELKRCDKDIKNGMEKLSTTAKLQEGKEQNPAIKSCLYILHHESYRVSKSKKCMQLFVVMLQTKILIPSMVHLRCSFLFMFSPQFPHFFTLFSYSLNSAFFSVSFSTVIYGLCVSSNTNGISWECTVHIPKWLKKYKWSNASEWNRNRIKKGMRTK